MAVLQEVEKVINDSSCKNVILNGDLNWDPRRNSGFAKKIQTFHEKIGLISLWSHFEVDYTHLHIDLRSSSILDHFFG